MSAFPFPKSKNATFKNLPIFGKKYLPQSVRLLEGGRWVETLFGRMPFEHALSLHDASLRYILHKVLTLSDCFNHPFIYLLNLWQYSDDFEQRYNWKIFMWLPVCGAAMCWKDYGQI